ncbi:probable prolyl 4-hydroxylase 7 isoform X1 [Triticum aestivum]|uniref:probable prolyl 4-hydroxylase 7 isoform X1 n=1 Tax=Triticum aestivum TaxID=4565 RepID=UPI0003D510A3|nr:probable prolyl 4-hydroxylase 7 isoform X1 [Triticum aestivum]XP_044347779.1 probable prolyl 4-hydroxylase 7 isoform X1 [Triticum aestivum]XP_044347780.1 probable prolyl 4-hydroxylase 7 isoform X1 [Triticum aestivum]
MLLKVMFSFFQPRGKIGSYHNNIDAGLLFRLADSKDIVVSEIEDRISLWSFIPKVVSEHGESMQILKYGANKSDPKNQETQLSSGANRLVTILMYLSDIKQGGETVFPRSEDTQAKEGTPSDCAGYAVKPVKGNAILLFNSRPDGIADKDSQYEACSVLEGEKWLAIKHMHASKIDKSKRSPASEDDGCTMKMVTVSVGPLPANATRIQCL